MNIKIRKAGLYDAAMISLIGKISFRDAFGTVFEKNNLEEYLEHVYNSEAIAARITDKSNVFFLALADNKPVGFAELKRNSLNELMESGSQMQLQKIYVLPAYQRIGAGTALLNEMFELAGQEPPEYIWLHVHAGNIKAIGFYERHGFRKKGSYYMGFGSQQFEFYVMAIEISVPVFHHAVERKMKNPRLAANYG